MKFPYISNQHRNILIVLTVLLLGVVSVFIAQREYYDMRGYADSVTKDLTDLQDQILEQMGRDLDVRISDEYKHTFKCTDTELANIDSYHIASLSLDTTYSAESGDSSWLTLSYLNDIKTKDSKLCVVVAEKYLLEKYNKAFDTELIGFTDTAIVLVDDSLFFTLYPESENDHSMELIKYDIAKGTFATVDKSAELMDISIVGTSQYGVIYDMAMGGFTCGDETDCYSIVDESRKGLWYYDVSADEKSFIK